MEHTPAFLNNGASEPEPRQETRPFDQSPTSYQETLPGVESDEPTRGLFELASDEGLSKRETAVSHIRKWLQVQDKFLQEEQRTDLESWMQKKGHAWSLRKNSLAYGRETQQPVTVAFFSRPKEESGKSQVQILRDQLLKPKLTEDEEWEQKTKTSLEYLHNLFFSEEFQEQDERIVYQPPPLDEISELKLTKIMTNDTGSIATKERVKEPPQIMTESVVHEAVSEVHSLNSDFLKVDKSEPPLIKLQSSENIREADFEDAEEAENAPIFNPDLSPEFHRINKSKKSPIKLSPIKLSPQKQEMKPQPVQFIDEKSPPKKPQMAPRMLPYVFQFSDDLEVLPRQLYDVGMNNFCNSFVPEINTRLAQKRLTDFIPKQQIKDLKINLIQIDSEIVDEGSPDDKQSTTSLSLSRAGRQRSLSRSVERRRRATTAKNSMNKFTFPVFQEATEPEPNSGIFDSSFQNNQVSFSISCLGDIDKKKQETGENSFGANSGSHSGNHLRVRTRPPLFIERGNGMRSSEIRGSETAKFPAKISRSGGNSSVAHYQLTEDFWANTKMSLYPKEPMSSIAISGGASKLNNDSEVLSQVVRTAQTPSTLNHAPPNLEAASEAPRRLNSRFSSFKQPRAKREASREELAIISSFYKEFSKLYIHPEQDSLDKGSEGPEVLRRKGEAMSTRLSECTHNSGSSTGSNSPEIRSIKTKPSKMSTNSSMLVYDKSRRPNRSNRHKDHSVSSMACRRPSWKPPVPVTSTSKRPSKPPPTFEVLDSQTIHHYRQDLELLYKDLSNSKQAGNKSPLPLQTLNYLYAQPPKRKRRVNEQALANPCILSRPNNYQA